MSTDGDGVSSEGADLVSRKQVLAGAAAAGLGLGLWGAPSALARTGRSRSPQTAAGRVAANAPYRIISPMDKTALRTSSISYLNGTKMAIAEINGRGGIQGRKITVDSFDADTLSPEGTRLGLTKAISRKPDAIGLWGSIAYQTAHDVTAGYGAPFMTGAALQDAWRLTASNPKKYFNQFQYAPGEEVYGSGVIELIEQLKAQGHLKGLPRTIFVIEGDGAYEKNISATAQRLGKQKGWETVAVEKIVKPINDWNAIISKVRSKKPGVVLLTDYLLPDGANFMRQWVARPVKAFVYIQYAPSEAAFAKLGGKAVEYSVGVTTINVLDDHFGRAFRAKYAAQYKQVADTYAGYGYDMTYMLARAWGMVENSKDFPAVCGELRRMVHRGVGGSHWFGSEGQRQLSYPVETADPSIGAPQVAVQVQGGKPVSIMPKPWNTGKYKPQPWTV